MEKICAYEEKKFGRINSCSVIPDKKIEKDQFRIFRKSPGRTAINRSISADPNMNDPEIQAKIGNRMTKTVEKSIGTIFILH